MTTNPGYKELPCCRCPARSASLCASLADAQLHRLHGLATERRFAGGEVILTQEQPADWVFSLRSGHAALTRLTADGRRQILAFLFPGDFFGLTSEDRYHYGVTAITDATTCRFDRSRLEELTREFPGMDRKLRFTLTRAMDAAFELVFSLGRKDALQKVASFIWYVGYRARKLGESGDPVHLPMRRADIADFLGLTTETVSRALTSLRQMGIIELAGPTDIRVGDAQALRSAGVVVAEPAPFVHADPDYYPRKAPRGPTAGGGH